MSNEAGVNLLRTFIAIDLPDPICQYLALVGEQMSAGISPKSIRWVAPDKMHLTLRFLGDTAENKLPDLAAALDAVTSSNQPFNLHLDQIGVFPNSRRPRVIWAGLGGDLARLNSIQSAIENAVRQMGWQKDNRPFRPHLTLGRVKDQQQARRISWTLQLDARDFIVSAVNLIESQLRPSGPLYTIKHKSQLGTSHT